MLHGVYTVQIQPRNHPLVWPTEGNQLGQKGLDHTDPDHEDGIHLFLRYAYS